MKVKKIETFFVTDEGIAYVITKQDDYFLIGKFVYFEKVALCQILEIMSPPVYITEPEEAVIWYKLNCAKRGIK